MANQRRKSEQRPSPEALLEAARREEGRVGKLRIFVGAAPGVGKTYEMLQSARARRQDGYDVVVGVVETHGRKETEALLEGLETVPRQRVEYRGQLLEEMDLDAIIARHPQIVLVDELAHTNAPGGRHPKRYLDVEELLSHGIDVYSTVNIQHIESLNDVVAQITHVRAGERILVCVSEDPRAAGLVRYAKRLADRLHGPWTALYVEGRRSLQYTEEERDRIADTLRLADSLGGEAVTIPSAERKIADDVIGYAESQNVTHIIIGKSSRSRWFEIMHGSVVHELVRRSGNISVHVIAGDAVGGEPIPKKTVRTADSAEAFDLGRYIAALAFVGVALGVGAAIQWLGIENVDLVFLTAV